MVLAILAVVVQKPAQVLSALLLNLNIFLVIVVSHPLILSIVVRLHSKLSHPKKTL